jgi:DNA-binding response OmpR family regulator/predicted transcriptional regulator
MPALELLEHAREQESDSPAERAGDSLVLLIDSDPSSVEFMARALAQAGVRVLIADRIGGPAGATALLRQHAGISVIVLDPQTVPGRDNLAELQTAGLREEMQIILVAEPVTLARYTQLAPAEVADFLPKPVPRRTLLRAVLEAQRRHCATREPPLQEARLARLVERTVAQPSRRAPAREQPAELRTLQLLVDLDDCRAHALDGVLEPDATWSMLSELLRARIARRRLSVTSLCLASKGPVTTALRRIDRLLEAGLILCTRDPKDRRRKYIELTADGTARLQEALRVAALRVSGEDATLP